jgi:large subunit ribosomal protein L29
MKRNDIKELHQKTVAQLQQQLDALVQDLSLMRLQKKVGKLSSTTKLKTLSDDIARIKTVISNKLRSEK